MERSGPVAAVTGASSGIGLATPRERARAGVAVVPGARRADRPGDAVRSIRKAGSRAEPFVVDVTYGTLGPRALATVNAVAPGRANSLVRQSGRRRESM